MIKTKLNKSRENIPIPMLTGIFLIGVCFFLIFVTSILFAFGVSITPFHLPFAVLLSAAVCFFLSGRSKKSSLIAISTGLLILCVAGIMDYCIPDNSWDGNSYHKTFTGFMRYGWNPLRETIYEFEDRCFPIVTNRLAYLDAYPKGSEIIAACFYSFTRNVEIGKIFNLISIAGTMGIFAAFLTDAVHLKKWQAWVCAAIFTVHPVSVSQAFTYYNDGFLWQMVLLCTAGCLYLLFFEKGKYRTISMLLVFATISIGFNLKFSGVIFFAIPCAGLFVLWAVRLLWKNHSKKEYGKIFQGIGFFSVAVLCGFLICGSTSYVINTVRHHNPFYSIIGEGANEIIISQMPDILKPLSEPKRVVKSLLSDYGATGEYRYKLPLLFSSTSVHQSSYDQRLGGWGILFSDLLVIGTLVLVIVWFKNLKRRRLLCRVMELFLLFGLLVVIVVPGLWWARYFVAPLYIPACAVVALFYAFNESNFSFAHFAAGCLAALCFVNVVPNFSINLEWYQRHETAGYDWYAWDRMRTISQREPLTLTFTDKYGYRLFFGRLFNLVDGGITNFQYAEEQLDGMHPVYQSYPILYSDPDHGVWTADNLVNYVEQAKKMENVALLISVKDEATSGLTDEMIRVMRQLGLRFDMQDRYRSSYTAVVENGQVKHEEVSAEKISYSDSIGGEKVVITSAGYLCGNTASILINGTECAVNGRGINIVLVDTTTGGVLDSVAFDTCDTGVCTRK